MEIEFFCEPETIAAGKHITYHTEWKEVCHRFLLETLCLEASLLRMRDHEKEELSHYSAGTTDIEFKFPF